MTIKIIRIWFQSLDPSFTAYQHKLTETIREKLISFQRGISTSKSKPIGGRANESYNWIRVNCIVHWTKSISESDVKAQELGTLLDSASGAIGDYRIVKIDIERNIGIGMDDNGIYEYAVEFLLTYKRKAQEE